MAKNKADKNKTTKLPKRIAGVRVPKRLRASGGSLAGLVHTPIGRQVLADALVAVAGSLVASPRARHAVGQAGSTAAGTARDVTEAAVGAVTEGIRQVLPGGRAEDERKAHTPRARGQNGDKAPSP